MTHCHGRVFDATRDSGEALCSVPLARCGDTNGQNTLPPLHHHHLKQCRLVHVPALSIVQQVMPARAHSLHHSHRRPLLRKALVSESSTTMTNFSCETDHGQHKTGNDWRPLRKVFFDLCDPNCSSVTPALFQRKKSRTLLLKSALQNQRGQRHERNVRPTETERARKLKTACQNGRGRVV